MDAGKVMQPQFGRRLRDRRVQAGMSQKELAGELITPSYISLLERGERVPTLDVVLQLAGRLHSTPVDLLGEDGAKLWPDGDPREPGRLRIEVRLRDVTGTGDYAESARWLEQEVEAARARGDRDALMSLGLSLQSVLGSLNRHADRLALLDELLALPVATSWFEIRLPLGIDRASTLRELGRLPLAAEQLTDLLKDLPGTPAAGSGEHVRLLGTQVSVLSELGELTEAASVVTEMLGIAGASGNSGIKSRAHWAASLAYARMGDAERARAEFAEAHRLASYAAMTVLDWLRFCRSAAELLLRIGDRPDAALRWIEAAEVTAAMTGMAAEELAVVRERARYELAAGRAEAAAELYARVTEGDAALTGLDLITTLLERGTALTRVGRAEDAVAVLRRAATLADAEANYRLAADAWRQVDSIRRDGA